MAEPLPASDDAAPDDGEDTYEDQPDGSVLVISPKAEAKPDSEFYCNLALTLPDDTLRDLSTDLLDKIEKDIDNRKKRDEKYAEGLRRTGMGDDAPGGADFPGASRVVHPILQESCIDYESHAIKELFPANGPVKEKIIGEETPEKLEKAQRKRDYMNWQLTKQMPEFRPQLEQLLIQEPMAGSCFMKLYHDKRVRRCRSEFIRLDDMILPAAADSYLSSPRKTHRLRLTQFEFESRVRSKMYRDVSSIAPSMTPEKTATGEALAKVEGVDDDAYNEDGTRLIFECANWCEVEGEDSGPAPYLITLDDTTREVLAVYRNWDEEDDLKRELEHMVDFVFQPWDGPYGVGFPQIMAGLPAALTGALRALLDSALINTVPSAVSLGSTRMGGQTKQIEIGAVNKIENTLGTNDIRQVVMPLPFNQPSPVLFQLLGWLDQAAKGIVTTAEEKIADASNEMPVGTALALIEQGSRVFSAIHSRQHASMARVLAILHRLNAQYLEDEETVEELGELVVKRSDFEGPMDVIPVSDPNIFSESQRYAQIQAVFQLKTQAPPGLYDEAEVHRRALMLMQVPDYEKLLTKKPEPPQMNPISENVALALGGPAAVFPDQNHFAHIQAHISFLADPMLGSSPLASPGLIPIMAAHLWRHIVFLYAQTLHTLTSQAAGQDASKLMSKDPHLSQRFDEMMAAATNLFHAKTDKLIGPAVQQMSQLLEKFKSMQPPPPTDPAQVAAQDVQRRAAADQAKTQTDQGKIAQTEKDSERKAQIDQNKIDAEERQNAADNLTALTISQERISSGAGAGNLTDGHGLGRERQP